MPGSFFLFGQFGGCTSQFSRYCSIWISFVAAIQPFVPCNSLEDIAVARFRTLRPLCLFSYGFSEWPGGRLPPPPLPLSREGGVSVTSTTAAAEFYFVLLYGEVVDYCVSGINLGDIGCMLASFGVVCPPSDYCFFLFYDALPFLAAVNKLNCATYSILYSVCK